MLVEILNGLVAILHIIAYGLTALLPETPFNWVPVQWGEFGRVVGLVFPIEQMAVSFSVLLTCFLLYYAIRWILRLIRQVQ